MSKMAAVIVALASLIGCASSTPKSNDPAPDGSGEWSARDADVVAQTMIESCLKDQWIQEWRNQHDQKRPVVRLYPIKNKTAGYIDYRYFTKQIEKALVSSRLVDVVSSREEADEIRDEKEDQAQFASDETVKAQGQEMGSDFVMNGWIIVQEDRAARNYLVTMEMIEVSTQRKSWIAEKKLEKAIEATK